MDENKSGLFISFEGNDGSGKTTQIQLLAGWFKKTGYEVVVLREPGGTAIGEKIRDILLDNANEGMSPITEMLLYAASRAQLVSAVIAPAVLRGAVVICDRFVDSSYAYQGYGRQLGLKTVVAANAAAIGNHLPNITFFLDLDASTSMLRRLSSGFEKDRLENEEMAFHHRVYEGYRALCANGNGRIKAIAVMQQEKQRSPEEVFAEIKETVVQFLFER